ncbi:hypothetical protein IKD67_01040 [Candidatus Saccharibacteria bacterium]|nr:hypothetical protein [Candidatus Saccharibacteria bacterium]
MLRTFWDNLSRAQKIGLLAIVQLLFIVVLVLLVQSFTREKSHVEIEDQAVAENDIPENAEEFIAENIWSIVSSKVADVSSNDIKDVVIREGTYEETQNKDGTVSASFIVDIDSLKQTFTVGVAWSKDGKTVYEPIIDCPPLELMKYPETVCYGAYHNTYSLDLYLPHLVYPENRGKSGVSSAPNIMITGDQEKKSLNIMVSVCDEERFKKEAWEYLNTLPIDFSDYTVNYEVNGLNAGC